MTPTDASGSLEIEAEGDIVTARTTIREVATDLGFGLTDTTRIVTAVSELARNAHRYAGSGTLDWRVRSVGNRRLLEIEVGDEGPGVADVERALDEGYTTSGGMGLGLSGSARLMDEFDIESSPETGTTVTVGKYLP